MSRAMNLRLPQRDVRERCDEQGIAISALEPLLTGGTHLVCRTIEGADEARRRLHDHLIQGRVQRFPYHRVRASE
ncbi:MAG: hypothetical protein KGM17_00030 [Sphingomonadales bacterium]|nr:hypothetical protein [Sphingomonadales bacterium]